MIISKIARRLAWTAVFAASFASADSFDTQRCINMGNALDAPNEGDWGHVIQDDAFEKIAEAGFDTVRIPVRWSAHTNGAPEYRIDESFFTRVTEVIDFALASDLQVILNIHHFEGLNRDPESHFDEFIALWNQIAPRYRDLPDSVYFEVINEPNDAFEGDVMRAYTKAAFAKIRESNPTRMLIVGGDNWSSIRSLTSIPKIDDPNQVYTFHYYDPFFFTHQKASWTNLKDSDVVYWGSAEDREELAKAATYAKQFQEESGIPVFLGEVGAYEKAPYDDVVEYTRETRQAFENAGISWCVWSFTATFPFFDSATQQWDNNKLAALGLAAPADEANVEALLTLEAAFNALRRDVGHDGELLMRPFPDELAKYGKLKVKNRSDETVPGGEAIEVRVRRAGDNPWDAGLSGALAGPVAAGDTVVFAYWARSVGDGDGVISNAGLQLSAEPYTPIGSLQPATLSKQWQRFTVVAVADRDYAPGEIGYTFQLAAAKQTIRIGPVFVLNLGQDVQL